MERQHFNNKTIDETKKFINIPIKLIPSINLYHIKDIKITKENFLHKSELIYTGNHFKMGKFRLLYDFKNKEGFKVSTKLIFTLRNE